jgi:hypothetical protein
MDALASQTTSAKPSHRSRHAAFVQENRAFRRRRTDTLDELLTLEPVGFRSAFAGVERLFFNRSSGFFPQRRAEDQLAETPCPILIFSRNSAIGMSACASTKASMNSTSGACSTYDLFSVVSWCQGSE